MKRKKTKNRKQQHLETNDNENKTIQHPWDAVKAELRGMFIVIKVYLKKLEKHQTNNITLDLKEQEKEEEKKLPKLVEGKEL